MRITGRVERFKEPGREFGFVRVSDHDKLDIFVSPHSMRDPTRWDGLRRGDMVSMQVASLQGAGVHGGKAPKGTDVFVIGEG